MKVSPPGPGRRARLRHGLRVLGYHLERLGRHHRLLPSHAGATKFLLLGKGRTGSSFLRGLLNEHPEVIAYAELFVSYERPSWAPPFIPATPRSIALLRRDAAAFLERHVYRRHASGVGAVGFKLLYDHARGGPWEKVWTYLRELDGLRVIHNKRRNLLRTFLSWRRAELTGIWKVTAGMRQAAEQAAAEVRISLDPEHCLEFFTATRERERELDAFFAQRPRLDVVYEDLVADRQGQVERVESFLGVRRLPLAPVTCKQAILPLEEEIRNYDALRKALEGTPWVAFFES